MAPRKKNKRRYGRKPVIKVDRVTGPWDAMIMPYGGTVTGTTRRVTVPSKAIAMDFGDIEHRLTSFYGGGRNVGKTDALYYQSFGRAYRPGREWMGRGPDAPLEPLNAGLLRILSRGRQGVRYGRQ